MTDPLQIQEAIQRVDDQQSFIQELLVGALGWDIADEITEIEDLTYGWSAEELRADGLHDRIVDGTIRQIRPFPGNPWGIFIVEFKHPDVFTLGRGMTGTLRSVLKGLVASRRKDPSLASYHRENLLFICSHANEHYRFAYFKAPVGAHNTAPLTTFGWGPDDKNAVRTICEYNLAALAWLPQGTEPDEWTKRWREAFDVEKVTKRFYLDYADVFGRVESIIGEQKSLKGDELRLFTQSLFNRLMFIRFIERKGWLKFPGQQGTRYLAALASAGGVDGHSLYASRIKPLFFEGLAEESKQNADAYGVVPLLNGGLFEKSDLDDKVVDISDDALTRIFSPEGLFYRYNFTVEESTPLDIEVAVDPEMLGKVFEELVTGRHESGSYYTPRPVVAFMCSEALKGHLANRTNAPEDAIAKLVDDHDAEGLTEAHLQPIIDALDGLKAIDPACGSGAYLLGLLQELIAIRRALRSEKLAADPGFLYDLKLQIISHNLYGVDIDPFATEIAKLRLWLSLAVEADQPVPLPNLDFKIETGDSLLGPDPQEMPDLFREQLRNRADLLLSLKEKHLTAQGENKSTIRDAILAEETALAQALYTQIGPSIVDWRVQFAEVFARNKGFDIVLANPPYGLLNKRQNQRLGYTISKAAAASLRSSSEFSPVLRGMVNVCTLFIRRSFSLLRPSGVFCEIFPLAFACDLSFGRLRSFVMDSNSVTRIEAFPERDDSSRRVFAGAKVSVCILGATKGRDRYNDHFALRVHDQPFVDTQREAVTIWPAQIALIDSNYAIPLVSQVDIDDLLRIYRKAVRLSEIGKCHTGEVDLTLCDDYISSNSALAPMHKGAIIDRYCIRKAMSQGVIEYLDTDAYLAAKGKRETSSAWHHREMRIVLQGITGMNEQTRLKMTLIGPETFCANSVNYIRL